MPSSILMNSTPTPRRRRSPGSSGWPRRCAHSLGEHATRHSLSPLQVQTLVFLRWHPEAVRQVGHLAREFGVSAATVSDAVRVLEAKELVTRVPRAGDRRSNVLGLTQRGTAVADELSCWADAIYEQLDRLPPEAQERAWAFVEQLIEGLRAAGVITVARTCRSCRYFVRDAQVGALPAHHCRLLGIALSEADLRLDCPEHEALGS